MKLKNKFFVFLILSYYLTCLSSQVYSIDAEFLMENMNKAYDKINNYSVYFIKSELIENAGMMTEHVDLIFEKPFSLKFNWREGPKRNTTVVYQDGKNNNKIRAKKSGLLGLFTFSLDINDKTVMKNNHHPVIHAGLGYSINLITETYRKAKKQDELEIIYHEDTQFRNIPVYHIEAILPKDKTKGYYCYRIVLYIDKNNYLPVGMRIFNWDNELYEDYTYLDLKANITFDENIFNL